MTPQPSPNSDLNCSLISACSTGDLPLFQKLYPGPSPPFPSSPPLAFLLYTSTTHCHGPLISHLLSRVPGPSPWNPSLPDHHSIPPEWQVFFPSIPCAAVATNNPDIMSLYLSAGLSVNEDLGHAISPLVEAVAGQWEAMTAYLISQGADPNPKFGSASESLLGRASALPSAWIVTLLLNGGAKIEGSHALRRAAEKGNVAAAEALLEKGADVNEMFMLKEGKGSAVKEVEWGTALHFAAERGQNAFAEWLSRKGADRNIKNWEGKTAKDVANEKGIEDLTYF